MKLLYVFICLSIFIVACAPRNEFYHDTETQPYCDIFQSSLKYSKWNLSGLNEVSRNVFECALPDSLGGASAKGNCIFELYFDNNENKVVKVNIIGAHISNLENHVYFGYDINDASNRRVIRRCYGHKEILKYALFFKEQCKSLKLKLDNDSIPMDKKVYCEQVFPLSNTDYILKAWK